jgi:hypothetical protein
VMDRAQSEQILGVIEDFENAESSQLLMDLISRSSV